MSSNVSIIGGLIQMPHRAIIRIPNTGDIFLAGGECISVVQVDGGVDAARQIRNLNPRHQLSRPTIELLDFMT